MSRRFNFGFGEEEQEAFPARRNFSFQVGPSIQGEEAEPEEEDPYGNLIRQYNELMSQGNPALDRYQSMMSDIPQRKGAGAMNMIAAALAGVGTGLQGGNSYAAVRAVREQPYHAAMENFTNERKILGERAEAERYDRTNRLAQLKAQADAINERQDNERESLKAQSEIELRERQGENYRNLEYQRQWERDNPTKTFFSTENSIVGAPQRGNGLPTVLPFQTTQGAGVGIARQNAKTNEYNAQTNRTRANNDFTLGQGNLQTRKNELGNTIRNTDSLINARVNPIYKPFEPNTISVDQQEKAASLALRELANDAQWRPYASQFFDLSLEEPELLDDVDPNSEEYKVFKSELASRIGRILNKTQLPSRPSTSGNTSPTSPDSSRWRRRELP